MLVCDVEKQDQIEALAETLRRRQCLTRRFGSFDSLRRLPRGDTPVSRDDSSAVLAGGRYLGVFADQRVQCVEGRFAIGCVGGHDRHQHHANGQRELWIHGSYQGGPGVFVGVFDQIVQPVQRSTVQRRRRGPAQDERSAGIPGYVDSYLYAEKVIPRGRAVETDEVAAPPSSC